jgi:prepilin-type N-terminal cleavage/methylation domain-containing protein
VYLPILDARGSLMSGIELRRAHHEGAESLCRGRAFTLIELLVTIAIIALLVALLVAALASVRRSSRGFECKNKLKSISFEFLRFADDFSPPFRGDSHTEGGKRFYVQDFQERLYGISEFWNATPLAQAAYNPTEQLLMCPAGPQQLQRQAGLPCDQYAVTPVGNVSIGFNMRLYRASVNIDGRAILKPVPLAMRLLQHPSVPLAFDVDGAAAAERGILPYYSAPPVGDPGRYGTGLFWFPSLRHGTVNACFVGGHVLSSPRPERQSGWDWSYQPSPE